MEKSPLVSIIMPVRNCSQFIEAAIDSVFSQTYTNWELLIYDGGSTDGTVEKIERYLGVPDAYDLRVKIWTQKHSLSGGIQRINFLIGASSGEYVAMMHGDDIMKPERIEKQVAKMMEGFHFCGTYLEMFGDHVGEARYPEGNINIKKALASGACVFGCPSVMMDKKTVIDKALWWNTEYLVATDYELWLRAALHEDVLMYNITEPLMRYRMHPGQGHKQGGHLYITEIPKLDKLKAELGEKIKGWN